jgi:hypothetical protein
VKVDRVKVIAVPEAVDLAIVGLATVGLATVGEVRVVRSSND